MVITYFGEINKGLAVSLLIFSTLVAGACAGPGSGPDTPSHRSAVEPILDAAPVAQQEGSQHKIVTEDSLRLTVRAPGAESAELFYRPATANERAVKLTSLGKSSGEEFIHEMKPPADFNGEVWARTKYPDGEVRETARLLLATPAALGRNDRSPDDPNKDESERSDMYTGGGVKQAKIRPGDPNIRITVNVPAFQLTLWQGDHEIALYRVGVGRKAYPIPIGMRTADQIILNPDWVPPDSEWVRESPSVEPYERIPADDPDNPLGKIKIPLGDAYLLHEAQAPSDIGNLVSHGCVRVMGNDLFALARLIDQARGLPVTDADFQRARDTSERKIIELDGLLPVDINYDTIVVEGSVLHIYPDVYGRKTNSVENLRVELKNHNVDTSGISDETLKAMIERVNDDSQFVVALSEIRAGRGLEAGRTEPIVPKKKETNEKT